MAVPAQAQENPSPDICAMEDAELLPALDGNWSFKQGVGRAGGAAVVPFKETDGSIAGFVQLMLTAKPPVELKLESAPNGSFSVLSGEGQNMVMVLADRQRAAQEIEAQSQQGNNGDNASSVNCGDNELPVIVGTNDYLLIDSGGDEVEWRRLGNPDRGFTVSVCSNNPLYQFLSIFTTDYGDFDTPSDEPVPFTKCLFPVEDREPVAPGFMRMTIVAQFTSRRSGSGYLYFDGEMNDAQFSAVAPITLTR